MAVCERCWADAAVRAQADTSKSQYQHYEDLLRERAYPCREEAPDA